MMINPQYKMIGALWESSTNREKKEAARQYRVNTKKFLMIPKSTPNELLESMIGDF